MTASLPGHGDVAGARVKRLTRLWIVGRRGGVVDVDEVVGREVGVERDAQQAALAGGVDGDGRTNGVRSRAPFLIDAQRPACSATKRRPSGANSMAVGSLSPLATSEVVKRPTWHSGGGGSADSHRRRWP